jgi:hypothetical protein
MTLALVLVGGLALCMGAGEVSCRIAAWKGWKR